MTETTTGRVNTLTTKAWNGKMLHGFGLAGVKGFYGLGTDAPTFSKGDTISFEFDPSNNRVVRGSVKKVEAVAASASSGGAPAGSYRESDDTRQKSIIWQSSRKDAIALFPALVAAGAVVIPKTPAKAYSAVVSFVEALTQKYYEDVLNVGDRPTKSEEDEPSMDPAADEDES